MIGESDLSQAPRLTKRCITATVLVTCLVLVLVLVESLLVGQDSTRSLKNKLELHG